MEFLINPNLAYMLVVVDGMLLMLTNVYPKSNSLGIWMALCLTATGIEIFFLEVNLCALLLAMLSTLLYSVAARQANIHNPLFLISIFLLMISSVLVFVDQRDRPAVSLRLPEFVSVFCGEILWITTARVRNAEGIRLSNDPDSIVGLVGEVRMDIEPYSFGSVLVEGELWQARSKNPILAGNMVRVLRQDGFWLTVKKVENLSKR